jgi:chromate transporter
LFAKRCTASPRRWVETHPTTAGCNVTPDNKISFADAAKFWLTLGFISFGGPAGQIAIMHRELVEKKKWISDGRFLHALNYCMVLPGPEAQQLATYIGWLMHRTWGGLIAGGLFVLPSMFMLIGLGWIYMTYGNTPVMSSILYGIKPAVVAIVLFAAWRVAQKALKTPFSWALAALAFASIAIFNLPFPLVVLGAAAIGFVIGKVAPHLLKAGGGHAKSSAPHAPSIIDDDTPTPPHARWNWGRFAAICAAGIALGVVVYLSLPNEILKSFAAFFTRMALVTFGGAYAVLPYVVQAAVEKYQWVTMPQMMDALALGETTPGPLIMVVTFVGYVAGVGKAVLGESNAFASGAIAAMVVTFFTFLPSFIFIFAGGPYVESSRSNFKLQAPLAAITACVVGVIASLAVFFGAHVFWNGRVDWIAVAIALAAAFALWRLKWGIISVIGVSALAGVTVKLFANV